MDRFSEVLKRGGLGYNYTITADVTMANEQKFNLSFTLNSLNKENALKEAYNLLEKAEYIVKIHNINEPKQLM